MGSRIGPIALLLATIKITLSHGIAMKGESIRKKQAKNLADEGN